MIRCTLIAAILAFGGLVPFFAVPPANAIPICKANYSCLFTYYSTLARTTEIGTTLLRCDGTSGTLGMTSQYFTFSEVPCNS